MIVDKNVALRNLDEVKEDLEEIIKGLKQAEDLEPLRGELTGYVVDLYMKLNKVYNAWAVPQEQITNCTQEQFDEWCRFPEDLAPFFS